MKKKKLFVGILLASAVFSLAACGNGTGTTTTSDTTPVTSDTTPETTPTTPDTPVVENYKVNFYSNGGSAIESKTVKDGEKITTIPVPTRSGAVNTYTFEGWYTDVALTKKFDFEAPIKSDITLYAKWTSVLTEATKITMNGTEYSTIKEAFAAIPAESTDTYTIIIPKGTYNENGLFYNGKATIKLVGATNSKYGEDVVIVGHGDDMTSENGSKDNGWKARNLITILGSANIILENLTLQSDWTRNGAKEAGLEKNTQAEVLGTNTSGNTVAYNCSFKSHQDTLRTTGKAWFYGCHVEGDTDFMWMEQSGSVALYENCEIVSVYDEQTGTHTSYITAPRMAISSKAGKGLVIYNSIVKESDEAKEKNQQTYLGRSPWESGYFSQVAYINTTCSDIEAGVWFGNPIPSEYERTVVGWKMDQATATSLNYTGTDILDETTVSNEFSGRRTILNRIFNGGKLKYEKDSNVWDIDNVIVSNGWAVDMDSSSDTLEDDTAGEPTIYVFDGETDYSSIATGFKVHTSSDGKSYQGGEGATITVPVSGKCYVEVYGYYQGTAEIKADTQGEGVMFFNNGTTGADELQTYTVYDKNASSVVLTLKATSYIRKIVVTPDTGIENTPVSGISVSTSSKLECVGVSQTLKATITSGSATNKCVKWSSSDTEVADIDTYTGIVTFKKEGTVSFIATACDGSGKTGSVTCHPIDPKWTACEWFTTDTNIKEEDATVVDNVEKSPAADGIENFSYGASTVYKALGSEFTWTNLAGKTFKTSSGLKLNSKGELVIVTTKPNALLTVVIAHIGCLKSTPSVKNGDTAADLLSEVESADGKTTTYVYALDSKGLWSIIRGDGNSENDPILYASCEYETNVITRDTSFVLGTSNTDLSDACTNGVIQNASATVGKFTIDATSGKLRLNSTDNAQINTGTKIKFTVAAGSMVKVTAFDAGNAKGYTINGVGTNAKEFERYYATETEVELLFNSNIYLEKIEVKANATAPTTTPTLSSISVSGYSTDEIAIGTDYEYSTLTVKAIYDDNAIYTLSDTAYDISNNIDKTTAGTYTVTITYNDGTTEKTATYDVKYVASVSNVISENTTFVIGSDNTQLNSATTGGKIQGTSVTLGKFTIDATNGTLRINAGNNSECANVDIKFTVADGATVKVTGYSGLSDYTLTDSDAAASEVVKTVTYTTGKEVVVHANSQYLVQIEISFA